MTGQRLFITGANRGIGLEWVRQAAEEGWQVIATARTPEQSPELLRLASRFSGQLEVWPLDVTDATAVESLPGRLGALPIDCLVNNAGVYGQPGGNFGQVDFDNWRHTFEVNVLAPMRLMQTLAPAVERSQRRLIASISSKMGSIADNSSGGAYVYRSSKAALNAVMKSASIELARRGITCVTLHPGWVKTDMGGPNALMEVSDSVRAMRTILQAVTMNDAGRFIGPDGKDIPW
jgi:NAD(P)-dependent dehydrogenase (short-subunit alcohol dehydrogenase family)